MIFFLVLAGGLTAGAWQPAWEVSGGSAGEPLRATITVPSRPTKLPYQLTLTCDGTNRELQLAVFMTVDAGRMPRALANAPAERLVIARIDVAPPATVKLIPTSDNAGRLDPFPPAMPTTRLRIFEVFGAEEAEFPFSALSEAQRKTIQAACFDNRAAAEPATGAPEILRLGKGIVTPRLMRQVAPKYTAEAMRLGIGGVITLEAVILTNGTVGSVRVTSCDLTSRLQNNTDSGKEELRERLARSGFEAGTCHETFGLDTEAIRNVRLWLFTPATKDGEPVRVAVEVEMAFRMK